MNKNLKILLYSLIAIFICLGIPPLLGFDQVDHTKSKPILKSNVRPFTGTKDAKEFDKVVNSVIVSSNEQTINTLKRIKEEREQKDIQLQKLLAENNKLKADNSKLKEDKNDLLDENRNKSKSISTLRGTIKQYMDSTHRELEYTYTHFDSTDNSITKTRLFKPRRDTLLLEGPARIDSVKLYRSGFLGIFGTKRYKSIHQ